MFSFLLLAVIPSCNGGSDSDSSYYDGVKILLPAGNLFMPRHFTLIQLQISNGDLYIELNCLPQNMEGDSISGPLAEFNELRLYEPGAGSKTIHFTGEWEQSGMNLINNINGLYIYMAEDYSQKLLLERMSIQVVTRGDDPNWIDGIITLSGHVSSGSLILDGKEKANLAGSEVLLIYTINPADINEETHGADKKDDLLYHAAGGR